jgi:hypothetical protein
LARGGAGRGTGGAVQSEGPELDHHRLSSAAGQGRRAHSGAGLSLFVQDPFLPEVFPPPPRPLPAPPRAPPRLPGPSARRSRRAPRGPARGLRRQVARGGQVNLGRFVDRRSARPLRTALGAAAALFRDQDPRVARSLVQRLAAPGA